VLDYARRKLRQRESTKPKANQSRGVAQKQPSPPEAGAGPEPVLSQSAEISAESAGSEPPAAAEPQESASQEPTQEEPGAQERDEGELPTDAPEWLKKRIARFTRQKHELERKIAEIDADRNALRGQVEEIKATPPEAPLPVVVNETDPASQFATEQQLDVAARQARELKRWCERNPEGGTLQVPDGKGGYNAREFSPEQVATMREATEDDLEVHFPKRREYLRQEYTNSVQAIRMHPWLEEKASPRFQKFREALEAYPPIRLRPDWVNATAIFVRGLEVVEAEMKAAAQSPAAQVPKLKSGSPPPKQPGPSATAPPRRGPIDTANAEVSAAEKEWKEKPDQRTFAKWQAAKRKLKQQQTSAA
jgi:hypothetical protein